MSNSCVPFFDERSGKAERVASGKAERVGHSWLFMFAEGRKKKRIRIIGIITATNKNKKYCHELELLFPFVS